jgi:hypothetical protein
MPRTLGGRRQPQRQDAIVRRVTAREKFLSQILSGGSDQNIPFGRLRANALVEFPRTRQRKSPYLRKEGVVEILNLQPLPSGKAKSYQVKQCGTQ